MMPHGFCGSGIHTGHNEDKLSPFYHVWGLSWTSPNTRGWNHSEAYKFSVWSLLSTGGLAGAVSWRILTCSHGHSMCCGLSYNMVADFQVKRGNESEWERENLPKAILLFIISLFSRSVLLMVEPVTKAHLHSRGGNIDPNSGWGCLSIPHCEHMEWAIYWHGHPGEYNLPQGV